MKAERIGVMIILVAIAATVSGSVQAGLLGGKKKKCDFKGAQGDVAIARAGKKCGFTVNNRGIGKKKITAPKKVAIGSFQVRYDKISNSAVTKVTHYSSFDYKCEEENEALAGDGPRACWETYSWGKEKERSSAGLELANQDVYQFLTNAIYDKYVAMLTERGYEVVPIDAVKSAPTYAMLGGKSGSKSKQKLIRTSAYGLKNLSLQGGMAANKLPGLNKDLKTDAVIKVFATVGLKLDKQGRFSMCLGSQSVGMGTGLRIELLAGYKESKMPGGKPVYSAKATADAGVPTVGCEQINLEAESAVQYVLSSANLVGGAATVATVMLEQAINK